MVVEKTMTSVRVELGFTKNLGNFENIRVTIGVEDYVRDGETVDSATERVYAFVEEKVVEKVGEMEKELNHG